MPRISFLFIFFFSICLCNLLKAQMNYKSLFDEKKFERIEHKVSKDIEKSLNDPVVLYTAAFLYSRLDFNKHDFFKAHEFCSKGQYAITNTNDKATLKEISELNLTYLSFVELSKNICTYEIEELTANKEFIRAQRFLDEFKDASSSEKNRAEYLRDEIALEDAKQKHSVEAFDAFISMYPKSLFATEAVKMRDEIAYFSAKVSESIDELDAFLKKYPRSRLFDEATNYRDSLVLSQTIKTGSESAFTTFIETYPRSIYNSQARKLRIECAYNDAKLIGTIGAYKYYCDTYPDTKYYSELNKLYNEKVYEQVSKSKDFSVVYDYIRQNPNSHLLAKAKVLMNQLHYKDNCSGSKEDLLSYVKNYKNSFAFDAALDTLFTLFEERRDYDVCGMILNEFPETSYATDCKEFILEDLKNSGDFIRISEVSSQYNFQLSKLIGAISIEDFESEEKRLRLEVGCNFSNEYAFDLFIQKRVNTDLAFVALQRVLEESIEKKEYATAIKRLNTFKNSFTEEPYLSWIGELDSIMNSQNQSILIKPEGKVNTLRDELNPIPSFDGKSMFFCGKNRADNIGGEDIYQAKLDKTNCFGNSKVLSSICTNKNEAPVSISADGNTLILWSSNGSGDIYYSQKMANGEYSIAIAFPEPINLPNSYEADAMLTADGKGMFFVSNREGGFNFSKPNLIGTYHGDNNYSTDIFYSHLLENGQWSTPVALDGNVNSEYSERSPYLHPDGKTLYFSSDGHGGLGRMDVFRATMFQNGDNYHWCNVKNMGREINTPRNDWGFKFSTDGTKAYFSREFGESDESSIILLLDVSGSMSGNKIESLKIAAKETASFSIMNNSEIAILAFDGSIQKPINFYLPFTRDLDLIVNFIDGLNASGGTPMYQAYNEACSYMKTYSSSSSKSKSIILMTDGMAEQGEKLVDILNKVKRIGAIYPTQCIALEVLQNTTPYNDLTEIARFSKGKIYSADKASNLNIAFAEATNEIFSFNSKKTNWDIFSLELPTYLRPGLVATVSGTLKNSNNEPIVAKMRWEDLESKEDVGESNSDPSDGSFFITLPVGRNYGYYAETEKYYPLAGNIDLRSEIRGIQLVEDFKLVSYEELKTKSASVVINNVFFEFGKFDLLPASILELDRLALLVNSFQREIELSGHTDNVGDDSSNQILSERRAESVKDYLISKGCDSRLLKSKGYGETSPVYPNDSDRNRGKNRRVEFKFIN
jgi:outer membrane protein OmpA-like peptidoglycan-associated protein/uncharacterized protein YegL